MSFEQLSVQILLFISSLLGVQALPTPDSSWVVEQQWTESNGYHYFQASSSKIIESCKEHPDYKIETPMIIHGAHTISLDNRVIARYGDPTFKTVRSFYGTLELSCHEITGGQKLTWRVDSYTKYFARFQYYPQMIAKSSLHNVFADSFHLIGAGGAAILAIFAVTLFLGKVPNHLVGAVVFSCLAVSIYFAGCVSGLLGIRWEMLTTHKLADISLWLGNSALIYALRLEGLLNKWLSNFFFACVAIAVVIIATSTTGDIVQLGTSVPFGATFLLLTVSLARAFLDFFKDEQKTRRLLQGLGLFAYTFACLNEVTVVTGLLPTYPKLPIGFVSAIFLIALAVNERINETYRERDYLRGNLELEVERKTTELKRKTEELETAMVSLKSTQAELIQSAKLASLGTLSAGIAHEINNSLNYVNGALQPLEKLIIKTFPESERGKIDRLLAVMKDGLGLTLEIIKSLRNYTGLNQAKFNDVNLNQVANSSLTILRNKTRGKITVEAHVPEDLIIFGSVVGINQVFMNLISNAIDAMGERGSLTIHGSRLAANFEPLPEGTPVSEAKWAEVKIKDSGHGMSPETRARIFEPFFTTKEVGKGTGLGLHIVRSEIDRHHAKLDVESELGKGTCFILRFPLGEAQTELVNSLESSKNAIDSTTTLTSSKRSAA